jgi:hypothetical protein
MRTANLRKDAEPPLALGTGSTADWHRAAAAQHNMLLDGPEASVQAALMVLSPYLREPVTWQKRGIRLPLPAEGSGALVLEDIAAMDAVDQARLRVWLDDPANRMMQVVSTTAYPVFPLVDCGVFDATLYYRLNLVQFAVGQE